MSHQVIITFDMDESKIQEHAEKEAGRQIAREISDTILGTGTWDRKRNLHDMVVQAVEEILLADGKDKIIEEAVKEVVANLHRTKKARELMESATCE